jgi:hypothetical protein
VSDLRSAIEAVREANGGRLTPTAVVDAARPDDHPLHSRFEWNDSIAGEAYRRTQAAELIRSLKIRYAPSGDEPERRVPAYLSVVRPEGRAYEPTSEVVRDPVTAELVRRDMLRDWHALKARYEGFVEFWAIVREDVEKLAAS